MHQPIQPSSKSEVTSSNSLILMMVIAVFTLCLLLFNLWLNHSKTHYTKTQLTLPKQIHFDEESNRTETMTDTTDEMDDDADHSHDQANQANQAHTNRNNGNNKKANHPNPPTRVQAIKAKNDWITVRTRPGDSLASVFKRVHLSQQTLLAILNKNTHATHLSRIKPNQQLQFLIKNNALEQLIVPFNDTQILVISRHQNQYTSRIQFRKMTGHTQYATATVHGSLYTTAQRARIPSKLIHQMIEIFNWNIDFARDIRDGDQFSLAYNALYVDDKWVSTGDILAVTYTNKGIVHSAIRHVNTAGDETYYTAAGTSLKKAFSRYPIRFSHISSTFSSGRMHPKLHYVRPHKGVDLAAPIGTPIHATGDGRIEIISRQNDYGNMIKISHNKTYSSIYGHLLKFQKGLSKGDFVKRGQVIGYVGQSGLATGPHCHYEFHINHQPKNPTTIDLPLAAPVPAHHRNAFKAKAASLLSQLKLYETAHLVGSKANRSPSPRTTPKRSTHDSIHTKR